MPHPADEPQRLSKVVAALVPCSRTQAEQYITEGWVRVDGVRIEEPQARVTAQQQVLVDPQAQLQPPVAVTLLLHKPAGLDSTGAQALLGATTRWSGDASGLRWTKRHAAGLLELVPLPRQASGLAVFSQDRGVVRKLREEAALVEQELVVEVSGTPVPDALSRLARGLLHQGRPLPPMRVSWQSEARLRIAGKAVPLELLPWMCAQVGLGLTGLRRLRIGRVPMAGVPAGQWRYLPAGERF